MNQTAVKAHDVMFRSGSHELFPDSDADEALEFFRNKSRAMANKVTTAKEAVRTPLSMVTIWASEADHSLRGR